jgi:RNA polymerase sigma-70 factor (ECF subfamily)
LVKAAVADANRSAVEALYRTHGDRIWRAVWAFARDPDLASDAVAEAFAQALARGDALRSPAGWIWRAVFRIAAGMLQERRRMVRLGHSASYEMTEVDHELLSGLQQLPRHQRATLILFYYADRPINEIADILQSSRIAVRVNLSRGRKRLRSILENGCD